ncbi:MAG TPA: NADH-quinone oxidoreductase subunit L [Armatimonadota bacterium]|nr:NADH-quinone oxidoreductase subunit L [Armatimonadota bacterium]
MYSLIWLVPIVPFAGFLLLAFAGRYLPRRAVAIIGPGAVGLSAAVMLLISGQFLAAPPAGYAYEQTLWSWIATGGLEVGFTLYLDPLSVVMGCVITVVGFLIHVYATAYMAEDEGYSKFFAYMNLFVGAMLLLVLGQNLLVLYLGWEGVGLCSYLLIGFWYKKPENGAAAMKAFIVTRIGDVALLIGLFLLVVQFGTLDIPAILAAAPGAWAVGAPAAVAAALLLLGGAVGKSAQLPLQTWLPDAMAGPTPVSALIHAATMVTAGVYLIARLHALFALAPGALLLVGIIGAATLLLAAFSALAQHDLKRILAYSTISQLGYMFLALGVGAWTAALFHFMTHAFFKALLFLGAGAIIHSLRDEQNIFRMGGLRRRLPAVYWTFLAGALALAAAPLITAGFYSKDLILFAAWVSPVGNRWLWGAGLLGAFLTALYTFRMVFLVFHGPERTAPHGRPGPAMTVPLMILALLSLLGGFVETPADLGGVHLFSSFLGHALPGLAAHGSPALEAAL